MKSLLKRLLGCVVLLYPHSFHRFLRRLGTYIYSQWIARALGSVGQNPIILSHMQIRGGQYVSIGDNFSTGYRTRIEAWNRYGQQRFTPSIIIGDNVSINNDCHFGAIDRITIGNNVLIGSRVLITDHNHGHTSAQDIDLSPALRDLVSSGQVSVGDDVWIGEGAAILAGVSIGRGAVIATNSVVTRSVPPFCVAAGVPARVIKQIKQNPVI